MSQRVGRKSGLFVLALFYLAVTASIHFLHTETTFSGGRDCPACQFNSSNSSPFPHLAFELPPLPFLEWAPIQEMLLSGQAPDLLLSPRAPPQG